MKSTVLRSALLLVSTICVLYFLKQYYTISPGVFQYQKSSNEEAVLLDSFIVPSYWNQSTISPFLPDLNAVKWPVVEYASKPAGQKLVDGTVELPQTAFEPVISRSQRAIFQRLLDLFAKSLSDQGLGNRWMLYGGTLLGSYRHHDFIPWDDDMDILVDISVRGKIQSILNSLKPDYILIRAGKRDKFCTRLMNSSHEVEDLEFSRQTSNYKWGWPYLDIGYYEFNNTHIREIAESYGKSYQWPTWMVFPLKFRPLGRAWYPAPNNTLAFLRLTYDLDNRCIMFGYSHVLESSGPSGTIPCQILGKRYAFVKRGLSQLNIQKTSSALDSQDSSSPRYTVVEESLVVRTSIQRLHVFHTIHIPGFAEEAHLSIYDFGTSAV